MNSVVVRIATESGVENFPNHDGKRKSAKTHVFRRKDRKRRRKSMKVSAAVAIGVGDFHNFPLSVRVFSAVSVAFRPFPFPSWLGDFSVQFFRHDSDGDRINVFLVFLFLRMSENLIV